MKKKVGNSMGQEEKYMDEYIKEISEKIEDKKEYYAKISDKIWEYAEPVSYTHLYICMYCQPNGVDRSLCTSDPGLL